MTTIRVSSCLSRIEALAWLHINAARHKSQNIHIVVREKRPIPIFNKFKKEWQRESISFYYADDIHKNIEKIPHDRLQQYFKDAEETFKYGIYPTRPEYVDYNSDSIAIKIDFEKFPNLDVTTYCSYHPKRTNFTNLTHPKIIRDSKIDETLD